VLPVLTFASGLIAGALGVQLLKKAKLSGGAKPPIDLRQAAVSGLAAMEASSASLRAKLTPEGSPAAATPPADEPAAPDEAPAAGPAAARDHDA